MVLDCSGLHPGWPEALRFPGSAEAESEAEADANSCVYIPLKGFLGTNNAWYGGRGRKTKPREEEGPSCEMVSDFTSLSAQIASSAFSEGPRERRVAFSLPLNTVFKTQHHSFSAGTKRVLWLSKKMFLHIKYSTGQMGLQALGSPPRFGLSSSAPK